MPKVQYWTAALAKVDPDLDNNFSSRVAYELW